VAQTDPSLTEEDEDVVRKYNVKRND